ncbi:hypothetical protein [Mycetocola zhujimingii]|uniref:Uncharacterized protein n=1 Tax=Mycetocola zhujimingii TaxID=2079792 RepID=A0A2U1THW4_9MICO|nr:hypothetical protein [Mycetocola zhujimingii]PWC08472.1 hypothetical protein DF223_03865 [Mycetocola zhujimingii]
MTSHNTTSLAQQNATDSGTRRTRGRFLRFLLGTVELLLVAALSMLFVDQVTTAALGVLDLTRLLLRPEGVAVVMTLDIILGTVLWMLSRHRTTRSIVAVSVAVAAAFAVPLVPFWFEMITATDAVMAGHVFVVPAIALTVALRPAELGPVRSVGAILDSSASGSRLVLNRVARRWPTVLALLLTFGLLLDPTVVPAGILALLGFEYLIIGTARRQFQNRKLLAIHIAGALAYVGLAALTLVVDPFAGGLLIAVGWILHAGWDIALHRANVVVWRWYAELCAVVDIVVGLTILVALGS